MEGLETSAKARRPEAMALLARAVSERLYPLDPGLACSWALRQVRSCFDQQTNRAGLSTGQSVAWRDSSPQGLLISAFRCAPHLVAILGLPLTIRAAEEELLRPGSDDKSGASWDEPPYGIGGGGAPGGATASCDKDSLRPVSGLLAAVAALGEEGEEEVWAMLSRVIAVALGGGGGSGAVASDGSVRVQAEGCGVAVRGQQQHQQQVAAGLHLAASALAVGEDIMVVISSPGLASAESLGGPDAMNSLTDRLEGLMRPLLMPEAADPSAQRRFDCAVRAVQMHVKRATSQLTLSVYERVLRSSNTAVLAAGASAPQQQQQQQQQQRQEQQRRLLLGLVRSRMQHLGQGMGSGCDPGGAGGGVAAAAAAGVPRGLATGDPAFAMQCLSDFARHGKDHLKKMAGLYKTRWIQGVKPVLLRPTLDEEDARLRHRYFKEASERFRLISDTELDAWEQLHEKLGVAFEGPRSRASSGGPDVCSGTGVSSEGAAVRSPVDDLMRRLAFVGPSLAGNTLDAVMSALEAALAEELSLRPAAQAPAPNQSPHGNDESEPAGEKQQHQDAAAAHIAELVLEAFVAGEELESAAAGTSVEVAPAPVPTTAATARPELRRRQSHLSWQLRLMDLAARWPQLHAHIAHRLLQLAIDPSFCSLLDEVQVMGLAAALAAMSCVYVRREALPTAPGAATADLPESRAPGGGGPGATSTFDTQHKTRCRASARYVWHMSRCLAASGAASAGQGLQQPPAVRSAAAEGMQAVRGPALAQAVLEALPLGPSVQQLRFTATFLAAYLRQCGLLGSWVLYGADDGDAAMGGVEGRGLKGCQGQMSVGCGGWRSRPAGAVSLRTPVPLWFSPPGDGCSDGRRRWQQQTSRGEVAGCIPAVALRSLVWIQTYGKIFGNAAVNRDDDDAGAAEGNGSGGRDRDYWLDVLRVCTAFISSGLGKAMVEGWAAACDAGGGGPGPADGGLARPRMRTAPGDLAALWDEAAMLRLTLRALDQGLHLPRQLMVDQAALLLRHMAPPGTQRRPREESLLEHANAWRREAEGIGRQLKQDEGQGKLGLGGHGGMEAVEPEGLPGPKLMRAL
ncbi:hypothetical protein Vafri_11405 [Volvox africanus]|nr:hypothetical protein Vafri_11405 [Volvox africanus]